MKSLKAVLPLVVLGILTLTPFYAQAASAHFFGPIIDGQCICKDSAPDWGCVLDTAHNVFNLIFSLSVLVFVITAALAGLTFMSASVNPEGKKKAKAMLLNTVVGLLIALSAWLIVDFVMRLLYNDSAGFGPWNSILKDGDPRRCLEFKDAPPIAVGVTPTGVTADVSSGSNDDMCPGDGCSNLNAFNVSCDARGCQVADLLGAKLAQIDIGFAVTEGYPPERTHCAVCHERGRCVDVGLRPRDYTAANIEAFLQQANAAGLDADFETTEGDPEIQKWRDAGITVNIFPGTGVSGRHFSVYGPWGPEGSTGGSGCRR